MKTLPDEVQHYKSTPVFTEHTAPKRLLKDHNTKNGVWGLICVNKGKVEYVIENKEVYTLSPDQKGVVEPEIRHHIKPLGAVSFFIKFYKRPFNNSN